MLKLGFDAKRLYNNFTGLGNYSRTIIGGLCEYFPEHSYNLFTPKTQHKADTIPFLQAPYNIIQPKGGIKSLWRSVGCTSEINTLKLDIYHGLSHELPMGIKNTCAKSLVTIHDLIYKTYPHDFNYIDRNIYDYKFRYACEKADKIIAVSNSTKNDLEGLYNIPAEKIEVIYQSCQANFKVNLNAGQINTVLEQYKLPKEYMLYVGSIIERKNLLGIVKALNKIKDQIHIPLIVVGNGKEYLHKVKQFLAAHKMEHRVIFTSEISFLHLPAIYQNAKLFLYPSKYEGFGIPVIEALWSKTPVITSHISSLPEAGGEGAHYCNPADETDIADSILKVMNDKDYSDQLVQKGLRHVKRFDSSEISKKLMHTYMQVLS